MGIVDFVLIGGIVTGAVYLLYRSIWKKGGYCHGCSSSGSCGYVPRGDHSKSVDSPASKGG